MAYEILRDTWPDLCTFLDNLTACSRFIKAKREARIDFTMVKQDADKVNFSPLQRFEVNEHELLRESAKITSLLYKLQIGQHCMVDLSAAVDCIRERLLDMKRDCMEKHGNLIDSKSEYIKETMNNTRDLTAPYRDSSENFEESHAMKLSSLISKNDVGVQEDFSFDTRI